MWKSSTVEGEHHRSLGGVYICGRSVEKSDIEIKQESQQEAKG